MKLALITHMPGPYALIGTQGYFREAWASGPRRFYQVRNAQGTGENIGNLYKGRESPGRPFTANGLHIKRSLKCAWKPFKILFKRGLKVL